MAQEDSLQDLVNKIDQSDITMKGEKIEKSEFEIIFAEGDAKKSFCIDPYREFDE